MSDDGSAERLGAPALPLAVLAGLNLVDEFDRVAFTALSPEIRDAFGMNDTTVLAMTVVPAVLILFVAGPIGRLTDRCSRVGLSLVAALLWGACAVLTALVPSVALLAVVRVVGGIGRSANEIVHPSLLSDLYPAQHHPRVFQIHRLANPVAQGSGVVAGLIGGAFGWRWAFYLMALPTFALAALLRRVPDPPRRGLGDASHRPLPLREAFGQLRAVASLRRLWGVAFFLSVAAFAMWALASLYFEQVWGYGAGGRGLVQVLIGVGWVAGVWIGGQATRKRLADGNLGALAGICGNAFLLFFIGGMALALAPTDWVALIAITALSAGNGVWQSPYFSAVSRLAPPGLSGQAFAAGVLVYAVGGLGSLFLGAASDAAGHRVGFVLVALFGLVAALLARSAVPLVEADLRAADAT